MMPAQVVGRSSLASGQTHAFLWSDSTGMVDLGTLGGSSSRATSVNNLGHVVGYAYLAGNTAYHAFRWASGTMTDLGTLGGTLSRKRHQRLAARSPAGATSRATRPIRAFSRMPGGPMVDLGTLRRA
jgi:probable HAF family extracellular repeat protein